MCKPCHKKVGRLFFLFIFLFHPFCVYVQSFETIYNEIPDEDKQSAEIRENVAYANFLYSGLDGYSK